MRMYLDEVLAVYDERDSHRERVIPKKSRAPPAARPEDRSIITDAAWQRRYRGNLVPKSFSESDLDIPGCACWRNSADDLLD